ncbi:MAG TPA: galactose oxidase-like domain-containing protein [Thermoanaerobaculia bacterium]
MPPGHEHDDDPGHVITAGGHEHERSAPPPLTPGDPGPDEVSKAGGLAHAIFRPAGGRWKRPHPAENPDPRGSFGYVGSFALLHDHDVGDQGPGTLVFPIDAKAIGGVARGTLRIFRWIEKARRWTLVPRTAPGQTRDYVWALIDPAAPGLYGLIGVHGDPLVARTLALHAAIRGAAEALGKELGREVLRRTCGMLLCDPAARKRIADREIYRALVEDNHRIGLPGVVLPPMPDMPMPETAMPDMPMPDVPMPETAPLPKVDPCETCRELADRGQTAPETALFALSVAPASLAGEWSLVEALPADRNDVLPVHAALLRTGKILYFGGSENVGAQNIAGGAAIDKTRLYDPATGSLEILPSPPRHDLFCCGHAFLSDGRLLAAGGTKDWGGVPHPNHGVNFEGLRSAAIFEPAAPAGESPWTPVERLRPERGQTRGGGAWYPALAALPDGKILQMGGPPEFEDSRHNNRMLEVFDPESGHWIDQGAGADIPASDTADLPQYPRLHVLGTGQVFCATPLEGPGGGPGWQSWTWNPANRVWTPVGSKPGGEFNGFDTSSVLLPLRAAEHYRAHVLYTNRPDPMIIDLSALAPTWQATAPRALSDPVDGPPIRYHATAVLLADGTVLLQGGHNDPNNWDPPVLTAELFDPKTGTWSIGADAAVPRVYHSVALLLPDGRVWTAGSDYGNGSHEMRMEMYSPPYLFRGARPTIAAAPDVVTIGANFDVDTPQAGAIATAALVRCGTATHAQAIDQRWVDLVIAQAQSARLTLQAPPNSRVAPPGYYMLFLLDGAGVPSVAKVLRLQSNARPTISRLYPRSGPPAGGSAVTILGTNFQPGATVTLGGVAATGVAVVSETEITVTSPARPPGTLHDVVVRNPDGSTRTQPDAWLSDFLDVPQAHLFHDAVERLFRSGVTAGCGGGNFCPNDTVTRAQMAIFLLRALHGPGWAPPPATGTVFTDVPANAFAAAAIERAAAEGIFPPGGSFGPAVAVTRAEMAKLLLRAEHGPGYAPPAAAGVFGDVPAADPSAPWIERLAREAITGGCGGGNYCPDDTSRRAEMAAFLVRTFGLP